MKVKVGVANQFGCASEGASLVLPHMARPYAALRSLLALQMSGSNILSRGKEEDGNSEDS